MYRFRRAQKGSGLLVEGKLLFTKSFLSRIPPPNKGRKKREREKVIFVILPTPQKMCIGILSPDPPIHKMFFS